ncbi:inorganic phosphate transporter [Thermasporomyces composti]|jgi:PiT family inorganic phosphate transporter|uniref:PiT family inorganic phosphate transporter n=1 Tax=Thermasporomyces composti TaxID=696763 RepID=A0A3D9V352_THECX|nr:inorganic phosphate transporter [Thermasporomyces composti]REF36148.1 PiT family inorganic phosphate transporter [Thermasporomyces composti]
MELALVVAVVMIALIFDYTNGFHDAANAIATSVSTRALTPRTALFLAAVMNLLGALISEGVASTIGSGIITPSVDAHGMTVVFSGLIGAITWNLITWRLGLPSSSSHALIGGLIGAGLAASVTVHWSVIISKVAIPMVLSPLIGFCLAYAVMVALLWIFRRARPYKVNRGFRAGQSVSAAAMAFGHGLQDAQKTMGVIVLALVTAGLHEGSDVPLWVKLAAAIAIALGTYSGGWRIMRTLGRRVIKLDPARGVAAELTASSVLYVMAIGLHAPVSTTHTISAAIMGVGATRRLSAVRWGVAGNIVLAWVLTIPMAAAVAAGMYWVSALVLP